MYCLLNREKIPSDGNVLRGSSYIDESMLTRKSRPVTAPILFGCATYRKMVQNLIWATGYNVIAIPLAAGVLYNAGIVLSPEVGAVFMHLSMVIVAINTQLLRVKKEELAEVVS